MPYSEKFRAFKKDNMLIFYTNKEGQPVQYKAVVIKYTNIVPEKCITFSSDIDFSIYVNNRTKNWDGFLYYSTDLINWHLWNGDTTIYSAPRSDGKHVLYMYGVGNSKITGGGPNAQQQRWILSGNNIYCNGSVESLLDYEVVLNGAHPPMASYAFAYLFEGCDSLITPPSLSATSLSIYCYWRMFAKCSNLTTPPELPATDLAHSCYYDMFSQCVNLEKLPILPATQLEHQCYFGMFHACQKLKISATRSDEYNVAYRIPASETGTEKYQSLNVMFNETGGTFYPTPIINTTYYITQANSTLEEETDPASIEQIGDVLVIRDYSNLFEEDGALIFDSFDLEQINNILIINKYPMTTQNEEVLRLQ